MSHGFELGVVLAVFVAGFRHGFDLDHIAAIGDITSTVRDRRRALLLATVYAVGHAIVLFALGFLAVVAGQRLPESFDVLMGRVIGASLIGLGIYVLYSLIRFRNGFRLRSRWMLVLGTAKRLLGWLRRSPERVVEIHHAHEHPLDGHHHADGAAGPSVAGGRVAVMTRTHTHAHTHVLPVPEDPFAEYGVLPALIVGMIHGVGAETPSQIVLFTTAAGVTGAAGGVGLLVAFVAGLFLGNSLLAVASTAGFTGGRRVRVLYLTAAGITAAVSLAVGFAYLLDRPDLLPPFLGGL
ncbi:MAG: hypothetical protein M3238_02800 [Actinomycetota bacterium]|nr:hypothetical protein [Actinomycetota bacterium]